jgi:hypothetical protein
VTSTTEQLDVITWLHFDIAESAGHFY